MPYRNVCLAVALLFAALCLTLLFLPEIVYWLFQIQGNELGDFLARRAAVLFLGLAILCFCSRHSRSSEVRRLVALAVGTAMAAMALLGMYELIWGMAGPGILVAVSIESAIAGLFFGQWAGNRQQ